MRVGIKTEICFHLFNRTSADSMTSVDLASWPTLWPPAPAAAVANTCAPSVGCPISGCAAGGTHGTRACLPTMLRSPRHRPPLPFRPPPLLARLLLLRRPPPPLSAPSPSHALPFVSSSSLLPLHLFAVILVYISCRYTPIFFCLHAIPKVSLLRVYLTYLGALSLAQLPGSFFLFSQPTDVFYT